MAYLLTYCAYSAYSACLCMMIHASSFCHLLSGFPIKQKWQDRENW
jgi:hypothetical protein